MGLYLCIFDDDQELEGVEVGSYADFQFFRNAVTDLLESGRAGSQFPTLILHPDSDGEWNPKECALLKSELMSISSGLNKFPPVEFRAPWQKEVASLVGLKPASLLECFIDIDGEPLVERLLRLCEIAVEKDRRILFQ